MKSLIKMLEDYRESAGIGKSEMARLMGANSAQQYNNWVARGRLPDTFKDQAIKILRTSSDEIILDVEILQKLEKLSDEHAKIVIDLIETLAKSNTD